MVVHVRFDESGGAYGRSRSLELIENEIRQIDDGKVVRRIEVAPEFIERVRAASKLVVHEAARPTNTYEVIDGTEKRLTFSDDGDDGTQVLAWDSGSDPSETLWDLIDILDEPFETDGKPADDHQPDPIPANTECRSDDESQAPPVLEHGFAIDDF